MLIMHKAINPVKTMSARKHPVNIAEVDGIYIGTFDGPFFRLIMNKRGQHSYNRINEHNIANCLYLRQHSTQGTWTVCGFSSKLEIDCWIEFVLTPWQVEYMIDDSDKEIVLSSGGTGHLVSFLEHIADHRKAPMKHFMGVTSWSQ